MSKDKNQKIKCDVDSCKFNNSEEQKCDLEEIKVSSTCDNNDCKCTEETICDSFEEKEDNEPLNNEQESDTEIDEYEEIEVEEEIEEE